MDDDTDDNDDRDDRDDRRNDRGRRDGNRKKNKGGPKILDLSKPEDLSEAESLTTRIVLNVVESMGDTLGTKFGHKIPFLQKGGAALVEAVGPTIAPLLGMGLTGVVAAKAQIPESLKALVGPYLPPIVSPYGNELLDSTIRAIGKSAFDGKFNATEAKRAADEALATFRKQVETVEVKSFDDALGFLTTHDRRRFRNLMQRFTPAQRTEFRLYELKLMHIKSGALIDLVEAAYSVDANQTDAALAYLRANYPDVKAKPDDFAPVKKLVDNLKKRAIAEVKEVVEHPERSLNEVAASLNAHTERSEAALRERKAQRLARLSRR